MMSMRLRTCCGIDGAVRQNCAAVSVVKKSTIADVADAATHVFERSCVDTLIRYPPFGTDPNSAHFGLAMAELARS